MNQAQNIPILLYHSVDDHCDQRYRRWNVTPKTFNRHMRMVSKLGCKCFTVSELIECRMKGMPIPESTIAITFDDGLADFRSGALPILDRYDLPATLYVVSGLVGDTSRWLASLGEGFRAMLTWQELRELEHHPIDIGAHTHSHPQLDLVSSDRARREIEASKLHLETQLERSITSFAYPHGYYSSDIRNMVRNAGYVSACRVANAISTSAENPFDLSRIIIDEEMKDEDFEMMLHGKGRVVSPSPHRLASKGWRLVRKTRQLAGLTN